MDADGTLFGRKDRPARTARTVELYERLAGEGFRDLRGVAAPDLEALARLHALRLRFYAEERRMHFGAFALVGLAAIILLPAVLTLDEYFLPLAAVEVLLLALLAPYLFYYRKYEETTRRMMRESFLLENARLLGEDDGRPNG